MDDFTLKGLHEAGFNGPLPFMTITRTQVLGPRGSADLEGIYVVTHEPCPLPQFLRPDHPKRLIFTPEEKMAERWVSSATVLYIGKAPFRKVDEDSGKRNGLWQRIKEYRGFIYRNRTNHAGGEDLRRLPARDSFGIMWKPVTNAGDKERRMIADFRHANNDMRPFGNRQDH